MAALAAGMLLSGAVGVPAVCYAISQVDASARRSDNLPVLSGMEMIRNAQRPLYVRGRRRHVSVVNETAEPQDGGIESPQTAFLFVPGAGGQAEQFFKQMTLFREGGPLSGHTAVLFSHSGHGPNTVEPYDWESLSFEELLEDVVEMYNLAVCILRKRFPPEKQSGEKEHTPRVLVVAHSYGCALSVCALSRMPLVSGVVLLAPPVKQPTSWPKWAILRLPSLAIDVIRVSDRTGGPDSPSVKRMLGEGGEGVEQEIARQQLAWNAHTPSMVVKALSQQAAGHVPAPSTYGELLRSSGVSADIVVGEHDRLTPASESIRILRAVGPTATLELLEGQVGHQVMVERPKKVNEAIVALARRF